MAGRDVIVIGTSAGGVEALAELARGLPPGFAGSVFVVCHFPTGGRSILPEILTRAGSLPASHAVDGEPFRPGRIYVAPPNFHLLLAPGERLRLTRDAMENHHRPAVDPLFRSAARHYGERVIGVILTGSLYDGAAGLIAIRTAGGLAVVQDPRDALVAAMPQNATQLAGADYTVPISGLAALLTTLVSNGSNTGRGGEAMNPTGAREGDGPDPIEQAARTVDETMLAQARNERRGQVAPFTCPECGGSLWQVDEPRLIQFRCHVGHAYNGEALLAEQSEALEAALWTAVRTFREKSVLGRQLADRERRRGDLEAAGRFEEQAEQAARYAGLIVEHVLQGNYAGAGGSAGGRAQDSTP